MRQSGRITFEEVNFEDDVDDFVKGVMSAKTDVPTISEEKISKN